MRDEIPRLFLFFTIDSCDPRQIKKENRPNVFSLSLSFSLEQVYMQVSDLCTQLECTRLKFDKIIRTAE